MREFIEQKFCSYGFCPYGLVLVETLIVEEDDKRKISGIVSFLTINLASSRVKYDIPVGDNIEFFDIEFYDEIILEKSVTIFKKIRRKLIGVNLEGKFGPVSLDGENFRFGFSFKAYGLINYELINKETEGRTMMQGRGFDWVLQELKKDHKSRYQRRGWNGKDMYISKHLVGHDEMMSQSYIYMKTADGNTVPWVASQTDILAEDWIGLTLVETI